MDVPPSARCRRPAEETELEGAAPFGLSEFAVCRVRGLGGLPKLNISREHEISSFEEPEQLQFLLRRGIYIERANTGR